MKKAIITLTVSILTASIIFAQEFNIGGSAMVRSFLAGNTFEKGLDFDTDNVFTHGELYLDLNASFKSNTGLAGAYGKIEYAPEWNSWKFNAVTWWYATPEIYLAIGKVENGPFEWVRADITAWGLNSNDVRTMDFPPFGNMKSGSKFWESNGYPGSVLKKATGFYRGPGDNLQSVEDAYPGMQVSIQPLGYFGMYAENYLTINIFFPLRFLGSNASRPYDERNFKEAYLKHMDFQVVYDFQQINSQAAFTYQNTVRLPAPDAYIWAPNPDPLGGSLYKFYDACSNLYFQWNMRLFGFNWEAGVHYTWSPEGWPVMPLNLGLGWRKGNIWRDDQVVMTSRLGVGIPMDDYNTLFPKSWDRNLGMYPITSTDLRIGWDFVLNYRLFPGFRVYVPVGLGFIFNNEKTLIGWQFSPYIMYRMGNNLDLYAGIRIFNGSDNPGLGMLGLINYETPENPSPGSGGLQKYNVNNVHVVIPVALDFRF